MSITMTDLRLPIDSSITGQVIQMTSTQLTSPRITSPRMLSPRLSPLLSPRSQNQRRTSLSKLKDIQVNANTDTNTDIKQANTRLNYLSTDEFYPFLLSSNTPNVVSKSIPHIPELIDQLIKDTNRKECLQILWKDECQSNPLNLYILLDTTERRDFIYAIQKLASKENLSVKSPIEVEQLIDMFIYFMRKPYPENGFLNNGDVLIGWDNLSKSVKTCLVEFYHETVYPSRIKYELYLIRY